MVKIEGKVLSLTVTPGSRLVTVVIENDGVHKDVLIPDTAIIRVCGAQVGLNNLVDWLICESTNISLTAVGETVREANFMREHLNGL